MQGVVIGLLLAKEVNGTKGDWGLVDSTLFNSSADQFPNIRVFQYSGVIRSRV